MEEYAFLFTMLCVLYIMIYPIPFNIVKRIWRGIKMFIRGCKGILNSF